jgi:hypothetical protein
MNAIENPKIIFQSTPCTRAAAATTLITGVALVIICALMLYALNNPTSRLSCLVSSLGNQATTLACTLLVAGIAITALGLTLLFTDPCFDVEKRDKQEKLKINPYKSAPKSDAIDEVRPFIMQMNEDLEKTNKGLLAPKIPLSFNLLQEEEREEAGWMLGHYQKTKEAHANLQNEAEAFLGKTKESKGALTKEELQELEKLKSTQKVAFLSMTTWVLIEEHLQLGTPPKEILKIVRQNIKVKATFN